MRLAWLFFAAGCGFQAASATVEDTGAPVDAAFNLASCPPTYDVQLTGLSHYRLIPAGGHADEQITACNTDLPGRTHLVVLDSMAEVVAVSTLVDSAAQGAIAGDALWIGGVQQRDATLPGDHWLGFDDLPLLPGQWATPGEPNDNDGAELDHREQFVSLKRGKRYFSDTPRTTPYGALCECDGNPVGPMATAAITSNNL